MSDALKRIIYDDGKTPLFSVKFPLLFLSKIFGIVVSLRRFLYEKEILKSYKPEVPVVSIGNITAGGTGKTPFTIYIARILKSKGLTPAVISRGYGGELEKKGGVVHDGSKLIASVKEAGDEPFMIAEKLKDVPVYVGADRISSAKLAAENGADLIILDDGFQHLKIRRDLDIILLDSEKPFGNGHLIPRGSLRDPVKQLNKGDIAVLTRSDKGDRRDKVLEHFRKEVFRTVHSPKVIDKDGKELQGDGLLGKKVFAFSGIAHNETFRKTAEEIGLIVSGFKEYNDHHSYTKDDMADISELSKKDDYIVTTEKDFVKVKKMADHLNVLIVSIEIEFIDKGFKELFLNRVGL